MQNIIRLTAQEKKNIDFTKKFLTLFYFQQTTVKKGGIYTLPTILKFGKRLEAQEIPPKLSFKNLPKVKCLNVVNKLKYEDLPKNIFKYSLKISKMQDNCKRE